MKRKKSEALFERAKKSIPGGVNSPVRAFGGVGGAPIFFTRGAGAHLFDADGKKYIDYVGTWGATILGHAHPKIVASVQKILANGFGFGAPSAIETELAETICRLMPSIEKIRLVNSGTEATMSAIRLARGFTGRDKILKFEGCYHGHADALLVRAGSGAATFGVPDSAGVPADFAAHTLTAPYNNLAVVRKIFTKIGSQIAAIIVEPVAGNMGCIPPVAGFLEGLRKIADDYSAVLIFDEVMTGFRIGLGGAQAHYQVKPDLTTLGKIIGGGLPVGAFGGKSEMMEQIAPLGPVYQAGTLSGNPAAVAAGLVVLSEISENRDFYPTLSTKTKRLRNGISERADAHKIPLKAHSKGAMFGLFFTDSAVENFDDVSSCDIARFQNFYHRMLDAGIYLAPSAFEAGFVSAAHSDDDIQKTIDAADFAFSKL